MAVNDYPKFKIRIAPDSKKRQGLLPGDVVRRQYADSEVSRYSLMVVTDTGSDIVAGPDGQEQTSPYFIGALLEGDQPRDGELLDFVRITSLTDPARSGALYLTASDSESPYMDVIDGMAVDHSLCYPDRVGTSGYTLKGAQWLDATYAATDEECERICMLRRNSIAIAGAFGLQQILPPVEHPQRIVISFRAKASKALTGLPLIVGYIDGSEADGGVRFDVGTTWSYYLFVITVDTPSSRERALTIDLTEYLDATGDHFSIAALNIVLQSDLSNFSAASKARVGRITGITDPLFGVLEGYGAYFQNLYATKNVNVAGTLTAGDENGFASTFYVGRIHKNALKNSLAGDFKPAMPVADIPAPTGIGQVIRLQGETILNCQTETWCESHAGQRYCFSFWASGTKGNLHLLHDDEVLATIPLSEHWARHHITFAVQHNPGQGLALGFQTSDVCLVCAYQLEPGEHPTLYQPTDEVLFETDQYGAWFSRGGIGGTIQNPLLQLNDDGSISSRDRSFVINIDGTGHFANGRFRWTKDTIALQGVTIRWDDFDEAAQEALLPKSVSISGTDTFHYADALSPEAQPSNITLIATEQNFSATTRRWDYLASDGTWRDASCHGAAFLLSPASHAWENREVLTLRYTAICQGKEYTSTFTVTKQYDGESAYSVYIKTDRGTILQNGLGEITLTALVMRGAEEVTEFIPENQFMWIRQSGDSKDDTLWNSEQHVGRSLIVSKGDVLRKAVFNCEVTLKK